MKQFCASQYWKCNFSSLFLRQQLMMMIMMHIFNWEIQCKQTHFVTKENFSRTIFPVIHDKSHSSSDLCPACVMLTGFPGISEINMAVWGFFFFFSLARSPPVSFSEEKRLYFSPFFRDHNHLVFNWKSNWCFVIL